MVEVTNLLYNLSGLMLFLKYFIILLLKVETFWEFCELRTFRNIPEQSWMILQDSWKIWNCTLKISRKLRGLGLDFQVEVLDFPDNLALSFR